MSKTTIMIGVIGFVLGCRAMPDRAAVSKDVARAKVYGKKGVCLTTVRKNQDDWQRKVTSLNAYWHYSWGPTVPDAEPGGIEFVPMIWGYRKADERFLKRIGELAAARAAGTRTHLLGYNEPDGKKQANMSVELAIEGWRYLEKTGLRLGSPAAVHADRQWMTDFMAQAKAKGLRLEFVCVHWYGGANPDALIDRLKKIHEMYGKPIWLTEFAPADWKAMSREENRLTPQRVLAFMQQVLPMLDELDFVERYAWYSAAESDKALGPAALFKADGSLTALGECYANHDKPPARPDSGAASDVNVVTHDD